MEAHLDALVASSSLEYQRELVRILENLRVDTFASATLAEAKKVLSGQKVALVFCDDQLIDGSYRDLLHTLQVLQSFLQVLAQGVDRLPVIGPLLRRYSFKLIK